MLGELPGAFAVALAGTLLAQAAPGPNLVAVAATALGAGRRAALLVVSGVASGVLVWALAMAVGLGAVLAAFPVLVTVMKLLGGGYLIWLAIKSLRAALAAADLRLAAGEGRREDPGEDRTHWRLGLLVVLTNPKAALMWVAVAAYLFGAGLSPLEVLAFGPVGALSAVAVYGAYALLFSTGLATRAYARAARGIEAAVGAVFGAMGAALLADGLRSASR